jgi:hypothetical protein
LNNVQSYRVTAERIIELAETYNKAFPQFPDSHLIPSERWLRGVWTLGNDYRNATSLYGAYPPAYLRRIDALLPPERRLHAFSGSLPALPGSVRVDLVSSRGPDIAADVTKLPFLDGYFRQVIADPPYSDTDAIRYGTPMVDRRKALSELARVTARGGILVWLDTVLPMFAKRDWHWFGSICVIRSTNHRVRLVSLFEKT